MNKEKFMTLSIRFNKEDRDIIDKLKNHGLNISSTIKILLREKLRKMELVENYEKERKK